MFIKNQIYFSNHKKQRFNSQFIKKNCCVFILFKDENRPYLNKRARFCETRCAQISNEKLICLRVLCASLPISTQINFRPKNFSWWFWLHFIQLNVPNILLYNFVGLRNIVFYCAPPSITKLDWYFRLWFYRVRGRTMD